MFKKSFAIVLIQIFSSLLGILSVYFIAGSMEPEVYSLTGIYAIIAGITLTFSDLGIETTMMREALYWKEIGDDEKVSEYATQALVSRVLAFTVLIPALAIYVFIINSTKYNGAYSGLLILFLFGGAINSLNNAMALIVRSQGGYVFAQAASTVNNYVLKFAGIGLYFVFGANAYLVFYGVSSIPLTFVYIIKERKIFKIKYIRIRPTIKKVWEARYLWLKTDLDYFKNNADSLLVSALFPAGIMGSYTIYKHLEQMSKSFIEGFFDVLSQHTVKYKGNAEQLKKQEKKIKIALNICIIMILALTGIYSIDTSFFIKIAHLTEYAHIDVMIYFIAALSIAHLIGKYEINAIAFFGSSKLNFGIGIAIFIASLLSYLIVIISPTVVGVLSQRVFIYFITSIISIIIFRHKKTELYTKILK